MDKDLSYEKRKIRGFDYWINGSGHVFNSRGVRLSPWLDDKGYLKIYLYKKGKRYVKTIHALVAKLFVENPHKHTFKVVMHLDDDRGNPHYLNLKWGKQLHNVRDMIAKGRAAWQIEAEKNGYDPY